MASKRSEKFIRELAGLIDALESGTILASERMRVAQILRLNTTDNPCLVNALKDEEIFVIISRDKISGKTVRFWSKEGKGIHEQSKLLSADIIANNMDKQRDDIRLALKVAKEAMRKTRKKS
jgi:hypothetical protein